MKVLLSNPQVDVVSLQPEEALNALGNTRLWKEVFDNFTKRSEFERFLNEYFKNAQILIVTDKNNKKKYLVVSKNGNMTAVDSNDSYNFTIDDPDDRASWRKSPSGRTRMEHLVYAMPELKKILEKLPTGVGENYGSVSESMRSLLNILDSKN